MCAAPSPQKPFQLYHMTDRQNGQTLSSVLRELEPSRTWGETKQRIMGRHVQINGNLCLDPARRLTPKDVIKVWDRPLPKLVAPTDVRIVYFDAHLVVVEKPAGVTSVRHFEERNLSNRRRQLQPTLDELLPAALAKRLNPDGPKKQVRRSDPRPKPGKLRSLPLPKIIAVHRLDRDTSGLMLFARTPECAELLGRMFRKHTIDRRYRAVVHGSIESQTIRSFLIRDVGGGRRGSTPNHDDPDAQEAITHVTAVERLDDRYSIVECKLETGRTHQIRIHLSEAGHRICGEPIYVQDKDGTPLEDQSGAPRHALHSWSLKMHHPISGAPLNFQSPWPPDLARWLSEIRKGK